MTTILQELQKYSDPAKRAQQMRYFQAHDGGYGAGDRFLGVSVPQCRLVSRIFTKTITLNELEASLRSQYHEERHTAIFICILQYKNPAKSQAIFDLIMKNLDFINNWDLVDTISPHLVGKQALKDEAILFSLIKSPQMWHKRLAIVALVPFIKENRLKIALELIKLTLNTQEALLQKASGWMLREIGKQNQAELEDFLANHAKDMPRTMLSYSLEKLSPQTKARYRAM